jgi:hypothetical protein
LGNISKGAADCWHVKELPSSPPCLIATSQQRKDCIFLTKNSGFMKKSSFSLKNVLHISKEMCTFTSLINQKTPAQEYKVCKKIMKNPISILRQYQYVITEQELDERLPFFGNELVILWGIGIGRTHGYGQYKMFIELMVGNNLKSFKVHTTDSELFDMDDTLEQYKIILDRVLDACSDEIEEWAEELLEEN